MYEERKEKFSFKSFFLTLLLVLLFVFLMLWLFPTKSYVDEKLQSTYDIERLSVLYDEIFANNVMRMKDAAIGYFTDERMPQEVGKSKKLTLQEMYDLHLVLKMKDKDGKACDTKKSYVEMTKYTEEYRLKVNLSCGGYEDYIIVYLGCYHYCMDGICEKQIPTPSATTKKEELTFNPTPTPNPTPNPIPTPDPTPTPDPKPEITKYLYEYKLVVSDSTSCTAWSNWSKNKIKTSANVKVETKTNKEITSYTTKKVPNGTKIEKVEKEERYISHYVTKLVVTDTKQVQVGTTTKQVTEKVQVGTIEVSTDKFGSGTVVPKNTTKNVYKVVSTDSIPGCSNCATEVKYTWEIYTIEPVYDVVTKTVTVPVYKTINVYSEQQVPVWDYRTVTEEKEVQLYKEVKIPVYSDVTYYRSKTCTVKKGYTDIKWSQSNIDTNLIGKGYKLTGNVKKI